ncbi:MAG TPA: protein-L-isoaspartate(D-aspartate) O-methyltransferase [Vicinamibacterales bacterium]|nr:protein-L-isoaspartate(D-aspartate) O-methyltransferase [Vicinamibacterales bacterium]
MHARARMVADQIRARGITDPRVLAAMTRVPRERFVPSGVRHEAFDDRPLPIGYGQTISQPYIVAFMTEALQLEPQHRVLEIGTGCGYQTAVLAELAGEIYSIELVEALAERARRTLHDLGYAKVVVRAGDGHAGWPEHAPFDRIIAAAAPPEVPPALLEQLADGGILVIPVGVAAQELRVLQKHRDRVELVSTLAVRFVPMIKPAGESDAG